MQQSVHHLLFLHLLHRTEHQLPTSHPFLPLYTDLFQRSSPAIVHTGA